MNNIPACFNMSFSAVKGRDFHPWYFYLKSLDPHLLNSALSSATHAHFSSVFKIMCNLISSEIQSYLDSFVNGKLRLNHIFQRWFDFTQGCKPAQNFLFIASFEAHNVFLVGGENVICEHEKRWFICSFALTKPKMVAIFGTITGNKCFGFKFFLFLNF